MKNIISSNVGKSKRILSLILSAICSMSVFVTVTACEKKEESVTDFIVKVDATRDARVLHISDPQLMETINAEEYCYRYIRQVVGRYDPDLIIVTGDLVYGKFDTDGSIFRDYIQFMETLNTPWAPVFGNHDNESEMGVDWQCQQLEKAKNCLFKQRELTGNGNYTVGIQQGDRVNRVFFMMDTNGCGSMGNESLDNGHTTAASGLQMDQKEWCKAEMARIKESYPEVKYSVAFHIQPYVFSYALDTYYDFENRSYICNLDEREDAKARGDFGYIGANVKSPWDASNVAFYELMECGVDSIFVGHEHLNSSSIMYEGVRLQYGQKCSQYDRYNKMVDGKIVGDYTHAGQPIMGGTKIDLCKDSGEIKDAGLILYDWTK